MGFGGVWGFLGLGLEDFGVLGWGQGFQGVVFGASGFRVLGSSRLPDLLNPTFLVKSFRVLLFKGAGLCAFLLA